MSELLNNREIKKEKLKEMLKKLHSGEDEEKVKEEFKEVLRSISPLEIPLIEQELVKEGITPREIARMCDIHVEIFRESVKGAESEVKELPAGHPLRILYEENIEIMKDAEILNLYASSLLNLEGKNKVNVLRTLEGIVRGLKAIGYTHYNREEMIHFPYLERRGLNAVPAVLWRKHDEIRSEINRLLREIKKEDYEKIVEISQDVASRLIDMVFRENNILYPTLKILLSEGEFKAIRLLDDEIGYYKVRPGDEWSSNASPIMPYEIYEEITPEQLMSLPQDLIEEMKSKMGDLKLRPDKTELIREGDVKLEDGYMLPEEISAVFSTMPVDVTFIDYQDRVRFFSGGERIFTRTKSVLGRPVQLCHPPKSVHIVNKILQAFKNGERNKAEFWIDMQGRKILIQYFAVRNKEGEYLGTLEFTQDITDIKKIEGERRLLEWS
ncbi:diguanylate cyclase [Euryarchaeota archaeon ex4484_178]|nr:MAG: diguanylate cyclase [Euryarchaeota archaeon ex4484_178]